MLTHLSLIVVWVHISTFKNIKARAIIAPGAVTSILIVVPSIIYNKIKTYELVMQKMIPSMISHVEFYLLKFIMGKKVKWIHRTWEEPRLSSIEIVEKCGLSWCRSTSVLYKKHNKVVQIFMQQRIEMENYYRNFLKGGKKRRWLLIP